MLTYPLIRRMAGDYDLPVTGGRLKLLSNCGVPGLDRDDSRLCATGLLANTVIPNGDTIAGLKYIARRFVAGCAPRAATASSDAQPRPHATGARAQDLG